MEKKDPHTSQKEAKATALPEKVVADQYRSKV